VAQGLSALLVILGLTSSEWYIVAVAVLGIYAGWYGRRMLDRYSTDPVRRLASFRNAGADEVY
jgi:hypothetical protein